MVVMGSLHRFGNSTTRIFGAHERERRVDLLRGMEDTGILLLRLSVRMPKTKYINFLCLPRCVFGGV